MLLESFERLEPGSHIAIEIKGTPLIYGSVKYSRTLASGFTAGIRIWQVVDLSREQSVGQSQEPRVKADKISA
jgi:hypothetical protein